MKTFIYKDELYIRVIPAKRLFNSTTVHEVVNRGDIFAVRVSDSTLTIIPGTAQVTHYEHKLIDTKQTSATDSSLKRKEPSLASIAKRLRQERIAAEQSKQRSLFGYSPG